MSKKMKAVLKISPEPNGSEFAMVDVPSPSSHEVLIKLDACSICGTDVHIFNWDKWAAGRIKTPLLYGHEFAGHVVEVGSDVDYIDVGDFVSGECHVSCGHCLQCRTGRPHICENVKVFGVDTQGIFAEYACIPAKNVWKNDKFLSADICSIQDPLGNAVHSVFSTEVVGKDVAIFGIGPIGAMCVSMCRHSGVANVIAIEHENEYRLNMARELGADVVYDVASSDVAEEITRKNGGVDVVLEMSGSVNAVRTGLNILRPGGELILLGIYSKDATIDLANKVVFNYVTIKGVTGRRIFDDWYRVNGFLKNSNFRKDIEKIITHRFAFDDFFEAMDVMRSGKSGKIVLNFKK